jgi:hypothetical protein
MSPNQASHPNAEEFFEAGREGHLSVGQPAISTPQVLKFQQKSWYRQLKFLLRKTIPLNSHSGSVSRRSQN